MKKPIPYCARSTLPMNFLTNSGWFLWMATMARYGITLRPAF